MTYYFDDPDYIKGNKMGELRLDSDVTVERVLNRTDVHIVHAKTNHIVGGFTNHSRRKLTDRLFHELYKKVYPE